MIAQIVTESGGIIGVVGAALTFSGVVVAGAWKALRDQQKDHAGERLTWLAAMKEQTQAVAVLSRTTDQMAELLRLHVMTGERRV